MSANSVSAAAGSSSVLAPAAELPSTSWFEHITGVEEQDFPTSGRFAVLPSKHDRTRGPRLQVVNTKTGARWEAGRFSAVRISDLEAIVTKIDPRRFPHPPKCPLTIVCREDRESVDFVDIGRLQADPQNRFAMFQAASNFNAIEAPDEEASPDDPSFTENYVFDRTQGPQASLGAGAAAIARVHAAFVKAGENAPDRGVPPHWRQTRDRQVLLLKGVEDYYTVQNGYVCLRGRERPLPPNTDSLLGNVCVGLHTEVQVTFAGADVENLRLMDPPPMDMQSLEGVQLIDQVFCAAMNVKQGPTGEANLKAPDVDKKALFLLRAAYRGTYLAALANRRQKLFLTLIGGGVFGNKIQSVFDIIFEEHQHWTKHPASRLKEVVLVLYSVPEETQAFADRMDRACVEYTWYAYNKKQQRVYRSYPPPS